MKTEQYHNFNKTEYNQLKKSNPDHILTIFEQGVYKLFGDDAKSISDKFNLRLYGFRNEPKLCILPDDINIRDIYNSGLKVAVFERSDNGKYFVSKFLD